jgi:hypothetical protein
MKTTEIKTADYYGHPTYYPVMPKPIFEALEFAFLNDKETVIVEKQLFDKMIEDHKKSNESY